MLKQLAMVVILGCGSTAAWADAASDCNQATDKELRIRGCTTLIQHSPDDSMAYTNRGMAYHAKGDYDRAIADYDRAIEINPKDASASINRIHAHVAKSGSATRDLSEYDRAIELDPKSATPYINRG